MRSTSTLPATEMAVPIVALLISALFEGLALYPLTLAGIAISVAGNVLVLRNA